MAAFGFSPAGFVVKPQSQILSDMQNAVWSTIDPELDLSFQTPDGQMLGIISNQLGAAWELIGIAANQYNREDVEGAGLDNLGDLVGIPREGPSYTTVFCNLTIASANAPYLVGTLEANIAGQPSLTFTNAVEITSNMISGSPEMANGVPFQSSTIGATPAVNAGTLTTITTPVTGWTAITNPAAVPGSGGTLGSSEELDSAYGPRQETELAAEGSCNPSATAAALAALGAAQTPPQTLTVSVLENTTPYQETIDGVVLLPHTFLVVVYDGGTGWASGSAITGTVALVNGSSSVTFSQTQTLPTGTQLYFAEQPGIIYTLASAITAGTAGTLTQPYTGTSAALSLVTIPGAGWQLIGETIYANKPAGITPAQTALGFAIIVDDPVLGDQVVYFTPPTPLPLYIKAQVAVRPGTSWPIAQQGMINALVAAAVAPTPATGIPPTGQLAPGSYVIGSQLEAVLMSVSGVFDVQTLTFGFSFTAAQTNTNPLSVSAIQIATITLANASNIALSQGSLP